MSQYSQWVACWGNATSISDRRECIYARDITLRYPIRMCFSGDSIRLHLSNLTGKETVVVSEVCIARQDTDYQPVIVRFGGQVEAHIAPGTEIVSDEVSIPITANDILDVSIYLGDYTEMTAGTLVTGPLSKGQFAYGHHTSARTFPAELSRATNWFYFLGTIDIHTAADNHALICYGDSITAQSWPDYLTLRTAKEQLSHVSIIRRAVCGTRILRQYECITYQAYGLQGAKRFPIESQAAGADTIIIQHGINDIIHPVGVDVNPFRPWSDMPSLDDLKQGMEQLYVQPARAQGLRVWCGTLLPIEGWRTYNPERDLLRQQFNEWLRTSPIFDGCIDFDLAVRDQNHPIAFAPGFDSGDHLHPSEAAYAAMADAVPTALLQASLR